MSFFIDEKSKTVFYDQARKFNLKNSIAPPINSICRSHCNSNTFYIFAPNLLLTIDLSFPDAPLIQDVSQKLKSLFRYRFNASSIHFGNSLYLIGGTFDSKISNICEKIDLSALTTTEIPSLNLPRASCGITSTYNAIYVMGGWGSSMLKTIEKFQNHIWTCLSWKLPIPLTCFGIVKISENQILIVGGREESKKKYSNQILKVKVDNGVISEEREIKEERSVNNQNVTVVGKEICVFNCELKFSKYGFEIDKWHERRILLTCWSLCRISLI